MSLGGRAELSVPLVAMRILFAHLAHSATVPRPATHNTVYTETVWLITGNMVLNQTAALKQF